MNTAEAAALLDVTTKKLRRHLRSHGAVMVGGTYHFTEADVERLRAELTPTTPRPAPGEVAWLNVDAGITIEELVGARHDPRARAQRLERRAIRQASLRDRLMELELWGTGKLADSSRDVVE